MRRSLINGCIGLALLLGASGTALATGGQYDNDAIRDHLYHVEWLLRTRDTSHLNATQRAARLRHLDVLREYRMRGVFPVNRGHVSRTPPVLFPGMFDHYLPGERVPIFVDEEGVHCAVGYLMKRSGHTDLVARVVEEANLAYVMEMSVAGLGDFAFASGFTAAELQMIQPSYGWDDCDLDGLDDSTEEMLGTQPCNMDSDGDSLDDWTEVIDPWNPLDTDGDGIIDALDEDDDNDGVLTIDEDRDGDGYALNDDIDGDGIPDPRDRDDLDGPLADADGDGILNGDEQLLGSNPALVDSDGDGLTDDEELGTLLAPKDTDGDGIFDLIDPDDDGDGVATRDELDQDLDCDGLADHHDAVNDALCQNGNPGPANRGCATTPASSLPLPLLGLALFFLFVGYRRR